MTIRPEKRKTVFLLLTILILAVTAEAAPPSFEVSGRHLIPDRWWETAAGIKLVALKKGRTFAHEISIDPAKASKELDHIKAEGFQAVEIFAPAQGLYAYSGLDTTNHYQIDPEVGTMDDFRQFIRIAHSKGLAVIAFVNIGYFSLDFLMKKQECGYDIMFLCVWMKKLTVQEFFPAGQQLSLLDIACL